MHLFKIPIGDWSDDGHGRADWYVIESNKKVEDVREAYFNALKLLPKELSPEYFMEAYEDHSLPRETYDAMKEHGFDPWPGMDEKELKERFEEMLEYPQWDTEDMCKYLLWFIKHGDDKLELTVKPEEEIPMFPFYGNDKKGRHISYIGYGLLGH